MYDIWEMKDSLQMLKRDSELHLNYGGDGMLNYN